MKKIDIFSIVSYCVTGLFFISFVLFFIDLIKIDAPPGSMALPVVFIVGIVVFGLAYLFCLTFVIIAFVLKKDTSNMGFYLANIAQFVIMIIIGIIPLLGVIIVPIFINIILPLFYML